MVHVLTNCYENLTFLLTILDICSGVPQGSVLAPLTSSHSSQARVLGFMHTLMIPRHCFTTSLMTRHWRLILCHHEEINQTKTQFNWIGSSYNFSHLTSSCITVILVVQCVHLWMFVISVIYTIDSLAFNQRNPIISMVCQSRFYKFHQLRQVRRWYLHNLPKKRLSSWLMHLLHVNLITAKVSYLTIQRSVIFNWVPSFSFCSKVNFLKNVST